MIEVRYTRDKHGRDVVVVQRGVFSAPFYPDYGIFTSDITPIGLSRPDLVQIIHAVIKRGYGEYGVNTPETRP